MLSRSDPSGARTTFDYDPLTSEMIGQVDPYELGEDPEEFTTRWTRDSRGGAE